MQVNVCLWRSSHTTANGKIKKKTNKNNNNNNQIEISSKIEEKEKEKKTTQKKKSKHFIMCAGHFIEFRLMEHYFRSNEICERNACVYVCVAFGTYSNNLYSIRSPIRIKKCRNAQLNAAQIAQFLLFWL